MSVIQLPIEVGMITAADAAAMLGTTEERLAELRDEGKGPGYVSIVGDQVRYYDFVIESWIDGFDRIYPEGEF